MATNASDSFASSLHYEFHAALEKVGVTVDVLALKLSRETDRSAAYFMRTLRGKAITELSARELLTACEMAGLDLVTVLKAAEARMLEVSA